MMENIRYIGEKDGVRVGEISTYENAPDAFLQQRRQVLRNHIRRPSLTTREFVNDVIGRMLVVAAASTWTAYTGIERAVQICAEYLAKDPSKKNTARKYLDRGLSFVPPNAAAGERLYFMLHEHQYEQVVESNSELLRVALFDKNRSQNIGQIAQTICENVERLGHNAAELRTRLPEIRALSGPDNYLAAFQKLNDAFKAVHSSKRHLSHYAKIVDAMVEKTLGTEGNTISWHALQENGEKLPMRTYKSDTRDVIRSLWRDIRTQGREDNKIITNKFRTPGTLIIASSATLLSGLLAYRASIRQHSLDRESELTHVERLQDERKQAQAGIPLQ